MAPTLKDDAEHWKMFGRWLRSVRKERTYRTGQPRHELAKKAGVSDNTWGTWERGGRNMGGHWVVYRPRPESLVGIARALELPAEQVFAKAKVSMSDDLYLDVPAPQEFNEQKIDQLMGMVAQLTATLAELSVAKPMDEVAELRAKVDQLLAERDAGKRTRRSPAGG